MDGNRPIDFDQGPNSCKGTVEDRNIPATQEAGHPALRHVERSNAPVDVTIEAIIIAGKRLFEKAGVLTSIPGTAKITAFAMLIEMPELDNLSGKKAALLAGLAPIPLQSGKWQGKEHILEAAIACEG